MGTQAVSFSCWRNSALVCALLLCSGLLSRPAYAADDELHKAINNLAGNPRAKKLALEKLGLSRDSRVSTLLDDFLKDNLFAYKDQVYVCTDQP